MIDTIGKTLGIKKDLDESNATYRSRVIYSMTGVLCKIGLLNISNNEGYRSKKSLLNLIEKKLELLFSYLPEPKKWFQDYNEYEIAKEILNRLISSGEVVKIGFNTDYTLSAFQEFFYDNNTVLFKGFKPDIKFNSTGLVTYSLINNKGKIKSDDNSFFSFYNLKDEDSYMILQKKLKNINWIKVNTIRGEMFDFKSKNILAKSWCQFDLDDGEVTIIKRNFNEFYFIKKQNDVIFESKISTYLTEKYEPIRYMLAFKSKNKSRAIFYKTKYYVRLRLFNRLPSKESSILLLFSWPVNGIDDKYNYIIHRKFWPTLKKILKNLCIELKESDDEL